MTNLDRTWKNCLRMWKWISEVYDDTVGVGSLKIQWLDEHGFTRDIDSDCFFCEYQAIHGGGIRHYRGKDFCEHCPGGYISKSFNCFCPNYHYGTKPKAFYAKLLELDTKRKM